MELVSERGSATVEAALLLPFILFIIFSFLYITFYLMDTGKLEGEVMYTVLESVEEDNLSIKSINPLEIGYKKPVLEKIQKSEYTGTIIKGLAASSYGKGVGQERLFLKFDIATAGKGIHTFFPRSFDDIKVNVSLYPYKATDVVRFYEAMT